jgi:RHS repeat-associated protein
LTGDGQYVYIYDCENRLLEVKQGETTIVTYAYDYQGRRVRKTVNAGLTTVFSYDGDQIIEDYNEAGVLQRKYVYGPGIDEPVYMSDSSGSHYYFFDGLGSVVALARTNAGPEEKYSYDVFGEPNRTSAVGNRYMFTGREYDSETGLYYYRARYYKPSIGRFMQVDPLGYRAGLNHYTYVANNPTEFRDPLGLMSCSVCQDRYRNSMAKIAADAAQCHNKCGPSSLGVSIGLCMGSCAETGVYFPVCTFLCGAAAQAPWAMCHYVCGRTGHENERNVTFGYNQCMSKCCHDEP